MNKLALFLFVLASGLFLTNPANAQKFEGILKMEFAAPSLQKPMECTSYTKGDKSVMDMQTEHGEIKMFIDQTTHKMTTVMESMKMGMEMDIDKMREMAKSMNKEEDDPNPKIEATGEKKEINGHSCELYTVTNSKNKRGNWWMTKDMPKSILRSLQSMYENSAAGARNSNNAVSAAVVELMFKKGLIPIRVESVDDGGKPSTSMTFTGFEEKHLDDSVFEIPSDIKIQKM